MTKGPVLPLLKPAALALGLLALSPLAFPDGGAWYLVRIDEPQQVSILKSVYPEFAGVDFPPSIMVPTQ